MIEINFIEKQVEFWTFLWILTKGLRSRTTTIVGLHV